MGLTPALQSSVVFAKETSTHCAYTRKMEAVRWTWGMRVWTAVVSSIVAVRRRRRRELLFFMLPCVWQSLQATEVHETS